MLWITPSNFVMPVVFEQAAEFKEQLLECKTCRKTYPTNSFSTFINQRMAKTFKYCRADLGKSYERNKMVRMVREA